MTADLRHIATADIGPLHCVLYRDAEGVPLLALYHRGPGSWSERWLGMVSVTGLAPWALGKALAWAREVRS